MREKLIRISLGLFLCSFAAWAQKYEGPRPPKQDIPFLVHANNLIPAEQTEATEESKGKDETIYAVAGPSSSARTPMAEPIFLFDSAKINPDKLELYKMEVKNGRREVTISANRKKSARPIHITVQRIDEKLFQIEAAEMLENGEYSLTPDGSNVVFCFSVY